LRARILQLKYSSVPSGQQLNELLPISLQLEKCPQQNDSVRILLLQRIGALYYFESKFSQAISYTESAINLLQDKSTSYADPAFLVKVYDFLQIYYDSLKLINMKMNAIDSFIHYALMTDAIDDQILYNIWQRSAYALDVGDFQRCINYSSIGEALTEKYSSPEYRLVYRLNFFTNRISALIGVNDLVTAEKDLHKKIDEFISEGLANECASFYGQLSIIARTQNNYDQAIKYHEKSFRSNKEHGYMLQCKQIMNNIGFLYLNYIFDPRKALKYFNEALKYKSNIHEELMNDEIETANILDNTGIAYSRLNMFDSAYFYFQKAFDILGKGTDENSLVNMPLDKFIRNPKLHYVTSLILEKGIAYAKQFEVTGEVQYLDESLRIFKIADKVLTKIKTAQAELQSRLAWRRNTRILYEKAINTCQIANRPHEAFYFFERSRAVLLNDQIYQNRSMSSNDINTKAQLERKLEMLNTQLKTTPPGAADYAALQKNILFLTQQKDRIVFQKSKSDSTELSLDIFRQKYALDNETLLEIFTGDSAVFIIAITKGNISLKKINKEKFDRLSSSFVGYVSDPVKSNNDFGGFLAVSNQLYHLVFDDIKIKGKLVISPDEISFPFEALVTHYNKQQQPAYLINERAVIYTYSAGYLLLDFTSPYNRSSPVLLGMAPVQFPVAFNLSTLQGSDESLTRIMSKFTSSNSVLSAAATKNVFLSQFFKYRIVQLYTHGAESGTAGVPVIYFADSALNLFDLIPVNRPATRLVILSACETAKGKYYKGEGVFSFNRAFAEAGIPSSMVNLWSVDNQSSYQLTELFYKYLSDGLPFDEALRQAKIEFISTSGKERSLPFYWAATVLAGQTSPGAQHTKIPWVLIAASILFLLAVVIVVFRYFNYKESYR